MTQHRLFIGAVAITVALGAVFFTSSDSIIRADDGKTYVAGYFDWGQGKGNSPIYLNQTQGQAPTNWTQFWKDWVTGTFPGAANTVMGRPTQFSVASNTKTGNQLQGQNRTQLNDSYLISSPLQFSGEQTGVWQHLTIRYKANRNEFKAYYRISDDAGTVDPNAAGWIEITGFQLNNAYHLKKLALNKTGKTFQYKLHLKDATSIVTGVVTTAKAKTVAATPTVSQSPATIAPSPSFGNIGQSPTPTPGTPTAAPTVTPSPATSPVVQRKFGIWQRRWQNKVAATQAATVNKGATPLNTTCAPAEDKVTTHLWTNYTADALIRKSVPAQTGEKIVSRVAPGNLAQAYVISQPFTYETLNANNTINWSRLKLSFANNATGSLKISYRVFDDLSEATNSATATDWIDMADPTTLNAGKDSCESGSLVAGYTINKTGRYLQYKVHVGRGKIGNKVVNQTVSRIAIFGEELSTVVVTPTPTPGATPTGTPGSTTPTPNVTPSIDPSAVGTITIMTRYLAPDEAPAPSPTASGPALPNLTPSPVQTSSPIPSPNAQNPLCATSGEIAQEVPVKIRQQSNGSFTADDEITDDEGTWQGLNGEIDEFRNGNYQITFGQFQNSLYKLVAFCVTPDNGQHYYKTQADPATGKITIIVRPGLETKVIALYGLRTKPFIEMKKFAIDARNLAEAQSGQQRVMKIVYPGQSFMYRIKYKNTSDTTAKNVLIQDVIPSQFTVPDSVINDTTDTYGLTVDIDAQRRTILKKTIAEIKPGEEGSIYIPVTLRATAFDGTE